MFHHLLFAGGNGRKIDLEVQVFQSCGFCVAQFIDKCCMVAKSLGGNATAVETGASHLCDFGNYHLQSVLGGIFCSPVTAGACSDND